MAKSKFDAVLGQHRTAPSEQESPAGFSKTVETTAGRSRGRPPGKRTNPDYQQVTVYLPRALQDRVKIALIQEGRKEFSELVEKLLTEWIDQHTAR